MIKEYGDMPEDKLVPIIARLLNTSEQQARFIIQIERGIINSDIGKIDKAGNETTLQPGPALK